MTNDNKECILNCKLVVSVSIIRGSRSMQTYCDERNVFQRHSSKGLSGCRGHVGQEVSGREESRGKMSDAEGEMNDKGKRLRRSGTDKGY